MTTTPDPTPNPFDRPEFRGDAAQGPSAQGLRPAGLVDHQGQPAVAMRAPDGATARVALHGGTLLSWIPAGSVERIYTSPMAVFDGATAIRGGMPVIFPQFSTRGPLQRHGFARNLPWQVVQHRQGEDYDLLTLRLAHSPATLSHWPHAFTLELSVCIGGPRMDAELEITNTGTAALSCMAALHTYLLVDDVEASALEGLSSLRYQDMISGEQQSARHHAVLFDDPVDRVYFNSHRPLLLRDGRHSVGIHQQGFPDVVVWNPWETGNASIADLPPGAFRHFVCVEAAAIGEPLSIPAGETWTGRQSLVLLS